MTHTVSNMATGVNHFGNSFVAGLANDSPVPLWQHLLMAQNPPNHLKAWREAARMTQEQVADAMDTTKGQVSRLENSKRRLGLEWIQKYALAVGKTPSEIMVAPTKDISRGRKADDIKTSVTISGNDSDSQAKEVAMGTREGALSLLTAAADMIGKHEALKELAKMPEGKVSPKKTGNQGA